MNTAPLLAIDNLQVTYLQGDLPVPALDRVSLSLSPGESLGLIGESGCGKTSLALAVMGLTPTATLEGSIRFQGQELTTMTETQYRDIRWNRIALAFQNSREVFNPVITVGEQVTETLIRHQGLDAAEAETRTARLFARVGLDSAWHKAYAHQLSGGMRQRVLMAMAVSCNPDLLIVDEPFTALDADARTKMTELLRSLQQELGFAMILISHTMTAIAQLTQNTLTLYAGQVLETGPTQALLSEPCHPYTRGLVNASPEFYAYKDLWGIPGTPPAPGKACGCPFFPRCVQHRPSCKETRPALVPAGPTPTDRIHGSLARAVACHRGGIATILEGRNLEKNFDLSGRTIRAVRRADIRVKTSEVVALVGPSGSGKSTLAHLLVALETPDRGEVLFQGLPLSEVQPGTCLGGMQLVFQDPAQAVSPRLTVLEAVREPLDILAWKTPADRRDKARDAVRAVHLPGDRSFLNRPCHTLSGGQRQRLSVARALVMDPVLLIADEITAMLDSSAQAHLLRQLKGLQHEKGFSMLFITHDLHLARKIADRAYVLEKGRIVAQGAGYQVFEPAARKPSDRKASDRCIPGPAPFAAEELPYAPQPPPVPNFT